jgi:CubicO group peptidase (beta-lactamase class C family)
LGMKSAGFGWPAYGNAGEPWGHRLMDGRLVPHDARGSYQLNAVIRPAGDIHLSIGDLGRFLDDQARGLAGMPALLKPATYARLHAAMPENSSLGWGVRMRDGHAVSQHSGSAETFYAVVMIGHDDGLEVALMLNSPDAVTANALFLRIWNCFRAPGCAVR